MGILLEQRLSEQRCEYFKINTLKKSEEDAVSVKETLGMK